jgi:choline dehydrogenase-like flavoprotein
VINDARTIVRGTTIQTDVCIIGAGAAGVTLALELLGSGRRILLLEAGGEAEEPRTQALYEGDVADASIHSPPDKYRHRRFGGTTAIWGGRCVPFDPLDFQDRSWIPHSGWPIRYEDVAAHYPKANAICEAGECTYDARHAVPGGMHPLLRGFAPVDFTTDRIERFSCPTDFGRRYRDRLAAAPSVRVLLHANCTRLIVSGDGGRIDRAVVQTLDGNRFDVAATQFVLAAGALETTRLLLASRDVHSRGIGNGRGLVGRYYMCHIAGTVGTLRFDGPADHVWQGYHRAEDGVYCRRRIAPTEQAQRREAIGNAVFRLHHPRIPNPRHGTGSLSAIFLAQQLISYEYRKRLITNQPVSGREWLWHVANVGIDAPATARFLWHWMRDRVFAERKFPSVIVRPRKNLFSLDFNAEQVPNPDSRVSLSERTDALGMPRLVVDWRYTDADIRTVATSLRLLQQELSRSALGELTFDHDEADVETVIRRDGALGGHHIGTTRMSSDPATGVVDGNSRVFGMHNLYVAGSAVFPTSSQANPTLTIVALAIRLARHIEASASQPVVIRRSEPAQGIRHPLGQTHPVLVAETVSGFGT